MNHCAILSMECLDEFEVNDHLIEQPLAELGWQTTYIPWRNDGTDWQRFDAVIIRSPWDYQQDPKAFLDRLAEIEQSGTVLLNNLAIVKWNVDKQYLAELEQQQVDIVPTTWLDRLQGKPTPIEKIDAVVAQYESAEFILKPRISANADNTFRLTLSEMKARKDALAEVFSDKDFMLQPFVEQVTTEGEFSLFYFNGEYSHCILKTPASNDFRVQEEHGGRLTALSPEPKLVAAANRCTEVLNKKFGTLLYTRLDFVRHQESFQLMEAELIEPSLYFNMDAESASRFAHAFVAKMNALSKSSH